MKTWLAPAKLNLFLHVVGQRTDGLHELHTLFQLLDLGYLHYFEITETGRISRDGGSALPAEDLCIRAAHALQQAAAARVLQSGWRLHWRDREAERERRVLTWQAQVEAARRRTREAALLAAVGAVALAARHLAEQRDRAPPRAAARARVHRRVVADGVGREPARAHRAQRRFHPRHALLRARNFPF